MLRVKPMLKEKGHEGEYARILDTHHLIVFGIGNTIGAGVFALTGVAAQYAGPSLFLSFLLTGCIALLTALSYAELSSRLPCSGSTYSYIYATFGELPGWLVGWCMNLRYGFSGGALARGWSSYFVELCALLGFPLPIYLHSVEVFGHVRLFMYVSFYV